MPQLNPSPWFYTLVIAWLVFLLVVSYKILNYTFTNNPSPISPESLMPNVWNWPWH